MTTVPPNPAVPSASAASPAGAASASPSGLSSPADIEALADELSDCADAIHKRVVKSVQAHGGKPVPDEEQAAARALLDAEYELRQRAGGLYADAATLVVGSLGKSQQHVMALTAAAADKIRRIGTIGQVVGLAGSVLGLAAAVGSAQPVAILGALDKLRASIKGVRSVGAPGAA